MRDSSLSGSSSTESIPQEFKEEIKQHDIPTDSESEGEAEQGDDLASISTANTIDQKSEVTKLQVTKLIQWTGHNRKTPVLLFRPDGIIKKQPELRQLGEKYHLTFKMYKTECKLVSNTLLAHGFQEAHPNSPDFLVLWTGSHLKPYVLRSLTEFQKVNHFPRSYEVTRKDRLYKNVQRMQQIKGFKHFDFLPLTFICPAEFQDFCHAFVREKGTWIVKPVASSRGRGIFLINHPDQLPLEETYVVCRYLSKPLLVDGFKFDLRIYVAVTSFDPLVIYIYEEGLARFATVRYNQKDGKNLRNQCMHLTNYSVNKRSEDFVQNEDAEVEDYGNKWSLGALLRCLRSEGHDTTAIMMRIEDVIIKTLISVEVPIATACKMFMPFKGNCFEVYGFDILLDSSLHPWVLEVNLSPSLACDAPIDLKIKSHMVADLLSLSGFVLHDPMQRAPSRSRRNQEVVDSNPARQQRVRPGSASSLHLRSRSTSANTRSRSLTRSEKVRQRPGSGQGRSSSTAPAAGRDTLNQLTGEDIRMIRRVKEEHARRGGWVRVFPTPESWDIYSPFLQHQTPNNFLLHQKLFPERYTSKPGAKLRLNIHTLPSSGFVAAGNSEMERFMTSALQRTVLYERKLGSRVALPKRQELQAITKQSLLTNAFGTADNGAGDTAATKPMPLVQGVVAPASGDLSKISQSQFVTSREPAVEALSAKPVAKVEPIQQLDHPQEKITPKEPSKPSLDLVAALEKGCVLTKPQARQTFASYLIRVQYRLLSETTEGIAEDIELANEQMDLVLRFLKRAAVNLAQPFKVVVPSRRLPLNDRRRILAKQLSDFVHMYSKETDGMNNRSYLSHLEPSKRIDQNQLEEFIRTAEETRLERVLTTYTKINKSAAIFLGSSQTPQDEESSKPLPPRPSTSQRSITNTSENPRGVVVNGAEGKASWFDKETQETVRPRDTDSVTDLLYNQHKSFSPNQKHSPPPTHKSSLHGAVYIYSSRLASAGKQRPSTSRPWSASSNAVISKRAQHHDVGEDSPAFDRNMDEVNAALQQLTMRQQERNYYSSNVKVPQESATAAVDMKSGHKKPPTDGYRRAGDAVCDTRKLSGKTTEEHIVADDSDPFDDELADAYAKTTGVTPSAAFQPSRNSAQFEILKQQQAEKQQRLMAQSKALLESSKAKHQVMVAQAHAATKRLHEGGSVGEGALQPRPPTTERPKAQVSNPHRVSRYPLRPSHSSEDLIELDFYSNVKYDTATGKAKVVK